MASRDLTERYVSYRSLHFKRSAPRPNQQENTLDSNAPVWVELRELIAQDIASIKSEIGGLRGLHEERLKVKFVDDDDEQASEQEIEQKHQTINALFKSCERNLKRIGSGEGHDQLDAQQRTVLINVMRGFATELAALNRDFRRAKQAFMTGLSEQEKQGNGLGELLNLTGGSSSSLEWNESLAEGLSEAQQQQLAEIERQASEREREIIHIAQSINELASSFKQLSALIIEQGTILDRIDYNIENALVKVKEGHKDLVEANKISKKMYAVKIMIVEAIIILILVIVLIAKHS